MRIIHFSDIHAVTPPASAGAVLNKRALGLLNHLLRRQRHYAWGRVERAVQRIPLLKPDLVVYTGDLTTTSQPAEFDRALAVLAPLVADCCFEFVCVPGNHDFYVAGDAVRQRLDDALRQLNRGRWGLGDFPRFHDMGQQLRLLLVDAAVPAPWYASYGDLAPAARQWLAEQLRDQRQAKGQRRLALIGHFPLFDATGRLPSWGRRCHHQEVLREAFQAGLFDVALCGHIHRPFARWEAGGGGEFCAGSLTQTGWFSVLDYDLQTNRLRQQWVTVDTTDHGVGTPLPAVAAPAG